MFMPPDVLVAVEGAALGPGEPLAGGVGRDELVVLLALDDPLLLLLELPSGRRSLSRELRNRSPKPPR
jgi:hypothetical protein